MKRKEQPTSIRQSVQEPISWKTGVVKTDSRTVTVIFPQSQAIGETWMQNKLVED